MDYVKDTREAYRNPARADAYKEQYAKYKWFQYVSKRERTCIEQALNLCNLSHTSRVLDIPCGTGAMSEVFGKFPFNVAASDISREMMEYARGEYSKERCLGFILSDIEKIPLKEEIFDCVLTIGFMHRAPVHVRAQVLKELNAISRKYIIVTYSINSPLQKLKHRVKKILFPVYTTPSSPVVLKDILREFQLHGLAVKKIFRAAYFFSSEVIFLLEKRK